MQGRAGSVYDSHLIVFLVIYKEKGHENKSYLLVCSVSYEYMTFPSIVLLQYELFSDRILYALGCMFDI